jgi:RNA polymerase II elongation factor ELL
VLTLFCGFYLIFALTEGIKEKDRKLIMPVLNAVGLMKDQAYHLARHIWNEVNDDWPFYTDQEKQILKR